MKKTLTIIGSGWLSTLFLNHYHHCFSSIVTTSKSSPAPTQSNKHIFFDIYNQKPIDLPKTSICLITLPFSRRLSVPNDYFIALKHLVNDPKKYDQIIFTSSTSVYKNKNNWAHESSELSASARSMALRNTENHMLNQANSVYVLRLSGICGYTRNSKHKRQQPIINHANQPVNLIHALDIIHVIYTLSAHHNAKDIINVTSSEHPSKKAYYQYLCEKFNEAPPKFMSSSTDFKKVSNQKLLNDYNISLAYPSPLGFEFNHV